MIVLSKSKIQKMFNKHALAIKNNHKSVDYFYYLTLYFLSNKQYNKTITEYQYPTTTEYKIETNKEFYAKYGLKEIVLIDNKVYIYVDNKDILQKLSNAYVEFIFDKQLHYEKYMNIKSYCNNIFQEYSINVIIKNNILNNKHSNIGDIKSFIDNHTANSDELINNKYLVKADKDKPMLGLMPKEAISAVAKVMEYGADKYEAGSWIKVDKERYINAALRHIFAAQNDDGTYDFNAKDESGMPHFWHALTNMVFVVSLTDKENINRK